VTSPNNEMIFAAPITGTGENPGTNAVAASTPEIDSVQTLSSASNRTLRNVGHHADID
jgi:hypothetical protein